MNTWITESSESEYETSPEPDNPTYTEQELITLVSIAIARWAGIFKIINPNQVHALSIHKAES